MIPRTLGGKKIAVLVENEFITEEIEADKKRFSELKATVHLMSRLWDNTSVSFFSDEDTIILISKNSTIASPL